MAHVTREGYRVNSCLMGFTASFLNEVCGSTYAFEGARSEGASMHALLCRKDLCCCSNGRGNLEDCTGCVDVHGGVRCKINVIRGDCKFENTGRLRGEL